MSRVVFPWEGRRMRRSIEVGYSRSPRSAVIEGKEIVVGLVRPAALPADGLE